MSLELGIAIIIGVVLGYMGALAMWGGFSIIPPKKEVDKFSASKELIGQIREMVQSQLLNNHPRLFAAIAKQKLILNDQDRQAVAIFISEDMFKDLIHGAGEYTDTRVSELFELMSDLALPVGYLGDLPIYISNLMESAPVFVVGEITWEI